MSAHAGGMCMSQCKHWRIHLFSFSVPRKEKENALKSPLSHCAAKIRFAHCPFCHPEHSEGSQIAPSLRHLRFFVAPLLRMTGIVTMVEQVKIDCKYKT